MNTPAQNHPPAPDHAAQTRARLDADLQRLHDNKTRWARLPLSQKLPYLQAFVDGTERVAAAQVQAAMTAKGTLAGTAGEAEEWLGGPVVQIRTARLLLESLASVARTGHPPLPDSAIHVRPDGRTVARIFPQTTLDRITMGGFTAEVWQQRDVTPVNLRSHMAGFYRQKDPVGAVALVLGAGNVASIGPLDVVQKLFQEGQVCLLKFNPVNAYLAPFVEAAFAPLIRDGFVATALGDGEVGAYLCNHPLVEEIHVTGSDRTHDAIVYGGGPAGQAHKAADAVQNHRRVTSELGNVSPVIVVPGPWTRADLRFHAENVATQMTNNGGFNCNAAKVVILPAEWPERLAFVDTLRSVLAALPQRRAYYPGAEQRYDHFLAAYPHAEALGPRTPGVLPWTLLPEVPATDVDAVAFTEESFCGLTATTVLPGRNAAEFLSNAVEFCNERLWGTLSASLIVHPRTEAQLGPRLDAALEALRYGTVVINHWPALGYGLGVTPWGAAPGHVRTDIQSGIGFVHNALMFDAVEKTIIRGPFRARPRPAWFVTHRAAAQVARRMVAMEARPGLRKVPALLAAALRG